MNTNYLIEWILKQSGLKVVFFVWYIDHVQTLRIGFALIWKEDILYWLVCWKHYFLPIECLLFILEQNICNVWAWSYTVNSGSFELRRDHQEGFSNQNECCSRSGNIRKIFVLDCSDESDKLVRHSTFHSQWFNANL